MRNILVLVICFFLVPVSCKSPGSGKQDQVCKAETSLIYVDVSQNDSAIFQDLMKWAGNNDISEKQLGEVIIDVAKQFMATPYVPHTLEQDGAEHLVVNFREFDCNTLVENVLALSVTIKGDNPSMNNYLKWLQAIRYRGGVLNQYPSRLHYFIDWMADNEQKGLIAVISNNFGDEAFKAYVNFMSRHADKYPKLAGNCIFVEQITHIEDSIAQYRFRYVSEQKLAFVEDRILDGDIIAFCSGIEGLDIAHVGFAVYIGETLHFLHASTNGNVVKISERSIKDYVNRRENVYGIIVARPSLPENNVIGQ